MVKPEGKKVPRGPSTGAVTSPRRSRDKGAGGRPVREAARRILPEPGSEEKILAAAREVFRERGLAGTRMAEIAERAGVNKALLHYYFRSKEKLFQRVFFETSAQLIPVVNQILREDLPIDEKIRRFVATYIEKLRQNPDGPAFVMAEIRRDPRVLEMLFEHVAQRPDPMPFVEQVAEAIDAGQVSGTAAIDFAINMSALTIFPFLARPMLQAIFGFSDEEFWDWIERRKRSVPEFLMKAARA